MIYDRVPDVEFLCIIGNVAYVHKHKPTREHILDTKTDKGISLGYARHTKGYKILLSQTSIHIVKTMHVTFTEDLVNYPTILLLSLPNRDGESFFLLIVPNIDFNHDNIASYAPHLQTINIGLMFKV